MKAGAGLLFATLVLCGCSKGAEGGTDGGGERFQTLRAARDGMMKVRALPGGKLATFTAVRLVGGANVCGMIDGNDGTGPRAFAVVGNEVLLADPRDPATVEAVRKPCAGPAREITSRNEQFTDIDVAE